MFLKSAHVKQYKSITDSGPVEFDREVSCLVGKNESGKTAFLEALSEVDARAYASDVKVPTLVTHLRDDAIVPFESGREVASLIPGAQLLSIEGRNHAFLLGDEAADIVAASMREFHATDLESSDENP